jgi:hypothetical protein
MSDGKWKTLSIPLATNKSLATLFAERLKKTGAAPLLWPLLATSAWLLAGCTTGQSDAQLAVWGDSLVDAQAKMNGYRLSLETMRDAYESGAASPVQCDPAGDKEAHEMVTKLLETLAADAPKVGFRKDVIERLHHMNSEWQLLRHRQETTWSESASVEGLDPRDRCLRASGVAWTRMAIDQDMSNILKAFIRAR